MQYFSADPCLVQQMNTYAVFSLLLYMLHRTWPQIQNCSVLRGHLSRVPQYKCIFIRKTKQSQNILNEAVLLFCVVLLSHYLKGG